MEHSSSDLQPCLQIASNSLRHGLVLKSLSVVEIASFEIKMKQVDGL